MPDIIKMYADLATKEEIDTINFGVVDAGESERKTVYLKNIGGNRVQDIRVDMPNCPNVVLIKSPTDLIENEVQELIVEWNPPFQLRSALQCPVEISGKVVLEPGGL